MGDYQNIWHTGTWPLERAVLNYVPFCTTLGFREQSSDEREISVKIELYIPENEDCLVVFESLRETGSPLIGSLT